jgi:hypothetical protein
MGWVGLYLTPLSTFNNISDLSWQSVLMVEETRVPGETHRPTLSHNVVSAKSYNLFGEKKTNKQD